MSAANRQDAEFDNRLQQIEENIQWNRRALIVGGISVCGFCILSCGFCILLWKYHDQLKQTVDSTQGRVEDIQDSRIIRLIRWSASWVGLK